MQYPNQYISHTIAPHHPFNHSDLSLFSGKQASDTGYSILIGMTGLNSVKPDSWSVLLKFSTSFS